VLDLGSSASSVVRKKADSELSKQAREMERERAKLQKQLDKEARDRLKQEEKERKQQERARAQVSRMRSALETKPNTALSHRKKNEETQNGRNKSKQSTRVMWIKVIQSKKCTWK
jgi:Tfp pilus assembly protein PilE